MLLNARILLTLSLVFTGACTDVQAPLVTPVDSVGETSDTAVADVFQETTPDTAIDQAGGDEAPDTAEPDAAVDTTPQDTMPQDTMPQDVTPQDTSPQDVTPQDTSPQDTTPQDTSPQDTTQDTSPDTADAAIGEVIAPGPLAAACDTACSALDNVCGLPTQNMGAETCSADCVEFMKTQEPQELNDTIGACIQGAQADNGGGMKPVACAPTDDFDLVVIQGCILGPKLKCVAVCASTQACELDPLVLPTNSKGCEIGCSYWVEELGALHACVTDAGTACGEVAACFE